MQQQPNALMSFLPLILIFVIFYLVMFLPMRKRQKKHQAMLQALQKGDRVITSGGIYGTVVSADGDVLTLRVADNVKLQVARSAVAGLASDAANVAITPNE
ncbi:MAG: preprotein translocase subunit YajC [Acidobacteriota bacterium]